MRFEMAAREKLLHVISTIGTAIPMAANTSGATHQRCFIAFIARSVPGMAAVAIIG
jgi:hypothetical protein